MNTKEFNLNFPFESPRQYQEAIVKTIDTQFESGKKFVVACLPTAIGKSAISVTLARYLGDAYFLTSQKTLQKQYINDFSKIGMEMIQGRSNFPCLLNESLTCESGVCHVSPKEFKRIVPKENIESGSCINCPYIVARNKALNANLCNMNYSYFFNLVKADSVSKEPKLHKRQILILDEAHNLEENLISYMEVKMSINDFKEHEIFNVVRFPKVESTEEDKFKWLFTTCLKAFVDYHQNESTILASMDPKSSSNVTQFNKVKYLSTIISSIQNLEDQLTKTNTPGVVTQSNIFEISFKPLFADKIANNILYKYADRILLMSATIFNKNQFCKNVGIPLDNMMYISCSSPIPSKNRPIKVLNNIDLSFKNKEANKPKLLKFVKDILDHHKNERGIIHTISYDIAKYLIENLQDERLIMPSGKDRDMIIESFINSDRNDLVLISPSLTEGISLNDDLSRFSIICKLPFKNLNDPWIQKRMSVDENWYSNETLNTLVQMTGRVVRSPNDYGINYILDAQFNRFYADNRSVFPNWWKDSVINIKNGIDWKNG